MESIFWLVSSWILICCLIFFVCYKIHKCKEKEETQKMRFRMINANKYEEKEQTAIHIPLSLMKLPTATIIPESSQEMEVPIATAIPVSSQGTEISTAIVHREHINQTISAPAVSTAHPIS